MNKKQKKVLIRIIAAAALMILLSLLPARGYLRLGLFLIPYLVIGYDILLKAGKGILHRQVFDENFLMAVATVGAIVLGEYTEGVAVMLFYQIGELFQSYAVGKSRRNISDLMDIRPDYANVERDGKLERVDPDEVEIGTVIVVQPGEKVPIDGIITEGTSSLNTSALTGESLPRDAAVGDEVISGCINMTGVLKIRTTREFGESTVSKILDSGGKFQFQEIPVRAFYFKICQILYAGGLHRRSGPGCAATAGPNVYARPARRVGAVDLPGSDLPGYQLSLRTGYQHSFELLCGNRRGQQGRYSDQGLQLSGNPVADEIRGV